MKPILLKYANHLLWLRIALVLAAWLVQVPTFAQGTVKYLVIGPESTEGNTASGYPFGSVNTRVQQYYNRNEFSNFNTIILLSVGFRIEGDTASSLQTSFNDLNVYLSTSDGTISSSFSQNRGSDFTKVFSGPITFNAPPSAGPTPFNIIIPFSSPFSYDPKKGNLVLEITQDHALGGPGRLDAFDSALPLLWGQISDDKISSIAYVSLVTKFGYTSVPEPDVSPLIIVIALVTGYLKRK